MNSLHETQIRKDFNDSYKPESETWMKKEYDDNVFEYWEIPNENYIVKFEKDDGLGDDNDVKNILSSPLGAFILCKSKRFLKIFIREINGFSNYSSY